jgi:hypothetical protein
VTTWSSSDGGSGIEVDYCPNDIQYGRKISEVPEDVGLAAITFPASDSSTLRFLSGVTMKVSSTNMYNGPDSGLFDKVNIGVTFTAASFYQTELDLETELATMKVIEAPSPPGPTLDGNPVSESLEINLTSSSPFFVMTGFSQIGGNYPLLHQSLGDCGTCERIPGVFGFAATFTYFEEAAEKYPCPNPPSPKAPSTLLDIPYDRFSGWNDRLIQAMSLKYQNQYVNVNQTLFALLNQNAINTVYTDMVSVHYSIPFASSCLNFLIFSYKHYLF